MPRDSRPLRLCILDNDQLDEAVAGHYVSYGVMSERLFEAAGAPWQFERFQTMRGEYPEDFGAYEAVLLTGSRADSFSDEPWVVALREQVQRLLARPSGPKLLGICFGHQLIAHCLGAQVGRAPQGWGVGRMDYDWCGPDAPQPDSRRVSLLASHQDQVLSLPPGATLLARSDFCPVAAYQLGERVFCVQAHPEFVPDYSAYLLDKRRERLGEALYAQARDSLALPHDGLAVARLMQRFVES